MFPNIVLVGLRGAGKSRASRRLAAAIDWNRVSTDEAFEARHGPIADFVAAYGWDAFREREAALLQPLPDRTILDCGGGIVERAENRAALARLGTVYWVRAPLALLRERVRRKASRPPLDGADPVAELEAVLTRRTPLYRAVAEADVWSDPETEAADALLHAHFGPGVAVSVWGEAVLDAERHLGPADVAELRADQLDRSRLAELLEALPERVRQRLIVTVRSPAHGGTFAGGPGDAAAMRAVAAAAGVHLVDVEYPGRLEGAPVLASHHQLEGPLPDLEALAARMAEGAAAVKIAVAADSPADLAEVHRFRRQPAQPPRIGIALGAAGGALRVLGTGPPGIATFAPPPGSPPTGPGQLDAQTVRDRHRRWGRKLTAPVPTYGVAGHPVAASLSPPMHEAALARLGIPGCYQRFEVLPDELEDFLTAFRLTGGAGLNLTIPLKEAVAPLLDSLDEAAHRIGAVNTVVREDDALIGANTDWLGVARTLSAVTALSGKQVTVLGAGGAARAVLHALSEAGARPTVVARNQARAAAVAARFGAGTADRATGGDILINATPVGMDTDASPLPDPGNRFPVVFDLVYRPARTRLLRDAEAAGAVTIPGVAMLVHQAAAAFERWTGTPAAQTIPIMQEAASRAG